MHEPAVKQDEDLVKKLLLRRYGQPLGAQLELHLDKHHLQQLLREERGKRAAFSETSSSHSSSPSSNSGSRTFCVRADVFACKKMDVVFKGEKGNPLLQPSFTALRL